MIIEEVLDLVLNPSRSLVHEQRLNGSCFTGKLMKTMTRLIEMEILNRIGPIIFNPDLEHPMPHHYRPTRRDLEASFTKFLHSCQDEPRRLFPKDISNFRSTLNDVIHQRIVPASSSTTTEHSDPHLDLALKSNCHRPSRISPLQDRLGLNLSTASVSPMLTEPLDLLDIT